MSYDSSGSYTPPTGAVTAVAGDIIRSALWNTINIQYSVALTALGYERFGTITTKTANYTVTGVEGAIIMNGSGTLTLTLPTASTLPGRWLYIKTIANQAVVASASVVAPLTSATAGVTIVAATAGKFAQLKSDGTSTWVIMAAN